MKRILTLAAAAAFVGSAGLALAPQSAAYSHRNAAVSGSATEPAQTGQTPTTADQFASESEAASHCRRGTVVWANTKTHVYHFAGNPAFGHTKHGAYMCQADADRSGTFRAAKKEKPNAPATTGSSTPPRR